MEKREGKDRDFIFPSPAMRDFPDNLPATSSFFLFLSPFPFFMLHDEQTRKEKKYGRKELCELYGRLEL